MSFLQAVWKVIQYIVLLCRNEIGLFDTGSSLQGNSQVVVPNPKDVGQFSDKDAYTFANSNPTGRNLLEFYYGFSSYMPTVMPITDPLRAIAAMFAKWLYWLDIAMQVMYVGMFNIMNIGGNTTYFKGNNYQATVQGMNLTTWFHDGQEVGTVVCIIMFMCYIIATMIAPSGKALPRLKTMFYCLFLGTGVVCAMPVLISFSTYGASSVAQGALGTPSQTRVSNNNADNNNNKQMNSIANQFFFNNVYSVPHKIFIQGTKPNQPLYSNSSYNGSTTSNHIQGIENQPNSALYQPDDGHNSTSSADSTPINIPLKIINLKQMSPAERESWNGLNADSITTFLNEYGGEDDVLDNTTLATLGHEYNSQVKQKAGQKAFNQYANKSAKNYEATHAYKNGHIISRGHLDATMKHINKYHGNGDQRVGEMIRNATTRSNHHASKDTPGNYGKTVKLYKPNNSASKATERRAMKVVSAEYDGAPSPTNTPDHGERHSIASNKKASKAGWKHVQQAGKQHGKNAAKKSGVKNNVPQPANPIQTIFEYKLDNLGPRASLEKLRDFGMMSKSTAAINHSYAMYKVSWLNIYLGLIIILVVFIAFIFKLLDAFFEAAVMYAVMDIMIARDMNDPRKMKQWIRNFFNLYAMLVIDVVIIRIFFIGYFTVNSAAEHIFTTYLPVQIGGNLTVLGIVESIMDIGLLVKCLEGNQAINEALGRPSGAKNGWGHALAFLGGARALGMGARVLGSGISHTAQAGKGMMNAGFSGKRKIGKIATGLKHSTPIHYNGSSSQRGRGLKNSTSHDDGPTISPKNPTNNNDQLSPDDGVDNQIDNTSDDTEQESSQPTVQPDANHSDSISEPTNSGKSQKKSDGTNNNGEKVGADAMKKSNKKNKNNDGNVKLTKDQPRMPQTPEEKQNAKTRALRSKGHKIQATGDHFFNGLTHVGNGIAEAGGGQGIDVHHDTDAAWSDPGSGDNPTEDQSMGTGEDPDPEPAQDDPNNILDTTPNETTQTDDDIPTNLADSLTQTQQQESQAFSGHDQISRTPRSVTSSKPSSSITSYLKSSSSNI